MSEHQRDTAFLRQCILYDDTGQRHKLEKSITQLQRNERCVRRAVSLMALFVALAMIGLGYSAVVLSDYPQNLPGFMTQLVSRVLCALALGSLVCMVVFTGLGVLYRKELDQRREECRRLAAKLLESRLGSPNPLDFTSDQQKLVGALKEQIQNPLATNAAENAAASAGDLLKK